MAKIFEFMGPIIIFQSSGVYWQLVNHYVSKTLIKAPLSESVIIINKLNLIVFTNLIKTPIENCYFLNNSIEITTSS